MSGGFRGLNGDRHYDSETDNNGRPFYKPKTMFDKLFKSDTNNRVNGYNGGRGSSRLVAATAAGGSPSMGLERHTASVHHHPSSAAANSRRQDPQVLSGLDLVDSLLDDDDNGGFELEPSIRKTSD